MIEKIQTIVPSSVYAELPSVMEKFQINTALRLSHFLGQAAHESGNFMRKFENLNYSSEGLLKIFAKYFPTKELADQYAHHVDLIANRVYANRMGNGDENSGDGYKYRGAGDFQITGKSNQEDFFVSIGLPANSDPKLIGEKYPLLSAAYFWNSRKLNSIADLGSGADTLLKITKIINGGTVGLSERAIEFNKFYTLLSV